jgi:pimeloyl-ACP methyl ester carboxylesterase
MGEPARLQKSTNGRSTRQLRTVRFGMRVTSQLSTRLASRWAEQLFTTPRRYDRPLREAAVLGRATPFTVSLGGNPLAAWIWGEGPAVLLVHGWEGRGSQLGGFVQPLVDRGFSVVAFDGPAHGDSGGDRVTLVDFSQALTAVTRMTSHVNAVHGVIAHSFGSAATTVALSRGLSANRVAYLGAATPEQATARFSEMLALPAEVSATMLRSFETRSGLSLDEVSGLKLARTRTEPLLVVHDKLDKEVPFDEGRSIAEAWPGAKLVATESLGHRRILWDPSVIDEVVNFIVAG